ISLAEPRDSASRAARHWNSPCSVCHTSHSQSHSLWRSTVRIEIRHRLFVAAAIMTLMAGTIAGADDENWITLFDGASLDDWEKVGNEQSTWEVKDGVIEGSGPASMLVCTKGPYKNFRYRAEIKINDGGNSGLYFRTTRKPGFSDGYEAQIDSTHTDPIRTGSLYGLCHVYKQLV